MVGSAVVGGAVVGLLVCTGGCVCGPEVVCVPVVAPVALCVADVVAAVAPVDVSGPAGCSVEAAVVSAAVVTELDAPAPGVAADLVTDVLGPGTFAQLDPLDTGARALLAAASTPMMPMAATLPSIPMRSDLDCIAYHPRRVSARSCRKATGPLWTFAAITDRSGRRKGLDPGSTAARRAG